MGVCADVPGKGAIDLDVVDGQGFDITQWWVAGAEVVDGNGNPPVTHAEYGMDIPVDVCNQAAFGKLNLQLWGVGAGFPENVSDNLGKVLLLNLAAGDIDGNPDGGKTGVIPAFHGQAGLS